MDRASMSVPGEPPPLASEMYDDDQETMYACEGTTQGATGWYGTAFLILVTAAQNV